MKNTMQTSKFQLSGLTCNACERVISNRLKNIKDVTAVTVKSPDGLASVHASRIISMDEVIAALSGTHYKVISSL